MYSYKLEVLNVCPMTLGHWYVQMQNERGPKLASSLLSFCINDCMQMEDSQLQMSWKYNVINF